MLWTKFYKPSLLTPNTIFYFQMTTYSDRPGYLRVSSSLWKQREDYCASLIQKAWKFHKLRQTESHTEEPHTGDEEEESSLCQTSLEKDTSVRLPPIHAESKHLIEVRSATSGSADTGGADKADKSSELEKKPSSWWKMMTSDFAHFRPPPKCKEYLISIRHLLLLLN